MVREKRRSRAAGWNLLLIALLVVLAALLVAVALIDDSGDPPAPHETAAPEAIPVEAVPDA